MFHALKEAVADQEGFGRDCGLIYWTRNMESFKKTISVLGAVPKKIFQDYNIAPEFYINYSPEW